MNSEFKDFINAAGAIRMREPLAAILGAFTGPGDTVEFTLGDVIKAAGHACPTVVGSFITLREVLARLYPDSVPVRGEIEVTIYGPPDEGVNGVMGQVFSQVTGAAPGTGFKGLGARFRRKDLLSFCPEADAPEARFRFTRTDNGRAVTARFRPWKIPFPSDKAARMARLMQQVVAGDAASGELEEFQELWVGKLKGMLAGEGLSGWLRLEEEQEEPAVAAAPASP